MQTIKIIFLIAETKYIFCWHFS